MNVPQPPSLDDDRLLVEQVMRRVPGSFERLIRQYQGLCWHIVSRMVSNREDARDLCQEAFLRVYRYLHQYRSESPLRSWVAQIAYAVALRHLERKQIPLVDGDLSSPFVEVSDGADLEAALGDENLIAVLHAEIQTLPPLQRTVLTLYYLDEVPIVEIARITGIAPGTIKSHLFRSRAKLRARLEVRMRVTDEYP
jgi:RNA polymerase sigma factor (sigma-70 family)